MSVDWRSVADVLAAELAEHGWGDFHYGDTGQSPAVLAALAVYEEAGQRARSPRPGTVDQWWPPTGPDGELVDMVALGVAHHHATGHLCAGGGDLFTCDGCDFAIEAGRVLAGGWVRFRSDGEEVEPRG